MCIRDSVGIDRKLCNLCVDQVHACDRRRVVTDLVIERLKNIARARIRFADEEKIRIEKIADNAAQGNEFGAVTQTKPFSAPFAAGFFERSSHGPARHARHNRAGEYDDMKSLLGAQSSADAVADGKRIAQGETSARFTGRRHDDESDFRSSDGLFDIACGGEVFPRGMNEFLESRLEDWRAAFLDRLYLCLLYTSRCV